MKKYVTLFLTLLSFAFAKAENKELFGIGKLDHSAADLALAPDLYKNFLLNNGGLKTYLIGYSQADKDWAYAFPGPLDDWGGGGFWAGYHPRHFPVIRFHLQETSSKGECSLHLNFLGAMDKVRWRVEINGHRVEKEIKGTSSTKLLKGEEKSIPLNLNIDFPSSWLVKGANTIQLGIVKGNWCVFDNISLLAPNGFSLGESSSTLIRSVKAADFEYKKNDSYFQPVLIDLIQYDKNRVLTFETDGIKTVSREIESGESIQEILLPATKKNKTQKFVIKADGEVIYSRNIVRSHQPLHQYSEYVDLLMGTGNSRWMFKPTPTLPLSMVQIAPDNQNETWKGGYEYTIENILGFNHISDWTMTGFIMQPTRGKIQVNPGEENCPDEGYRSRIDKKSEVAKIGKYSVYMTDTDIKAEITSTRRAAMQRYTFPKDKNSRVLIDLFAPNEYPYNLVDAKVTKVNNNEICGQATYQGSFTGYTLNQEYTLYFVLQFDKPFYSMCGWTNNEIKPVTHYINGWHRTHEYSTDPTITYDINELSGKGDAGVFLNFDTRHHEQILVRSGISLVDLDGARDNLSQEISKPFGWNFEQVEENAKKEWNELLGRVEIETDDYLQKKKFYTNMYRALSAKAIWSDHDGRFVDENEKVCTLKDKGDCIVSGEYWNTFWDNQQLFNLVAPEISSKWARSAIHLYENSGWFNTDPAGIEHTGVMVAMHPISQILGAWQSGIRDFDLNAAFKGLKKMMTTPPRNYEGGGTVGVEHLVPYMKYGYIPSGHGLSSNTLEYSYDDWCLGQMAKLLGKTEDYQYFDTRSNNWKNLFDSETGFIRPKNEEGEWITPFDPYSTPGFTEGNAFNYSWFAPHNPSELVKMVGRDRFVTRLNEAFEKSSFANFNAAGDAFHEYPINHGNETSMEVAYLFNWAGSPHLTQKWARAIQEQYYGTTPYDAYPGDEDLGQMSSWYVMSVIGLFQMDGGCSINPIYELGSPRFTKVTIHLSPKYHHGKTFEIVAKNASKQKKYIQSARLNGKEWTSWKIPTSEVFNGGKLELIMDDVPSQWAR